MLRIDLGIFVGSGGEGVDKGVWDELGAFISDLACCVFEIL